MNIIVYELDKEPYIKEIDNTLEAMQEVVGGYIEPVQVATDAIAICNEEGVIRGLPINKRGRITLFGTFFICKVKGESFTGFSLKQANEIMKYFK